MSRLGQTRPSHSALASKNGRYASDSDQNGATPRMTLCAISDHHSLSEDFDRINIYGTHAPVEEPSTASEADIYDVAVRNPAFTKEKPRGMARGFVLARS